MATNTSFFSAFPGTYDSALIVYTGANSALKYSTILNGANKLGTTGGAILGFSTAQAQPTNKLFNTSMNWPFLGVRDSYNQNGPQIASTVNGVTKAISSGVFAGLVQGKYIMLGLNSGQVAGITTGTLSTIMNFPGGHYNVVGQNLANKYRNTWLKRISGGWYYQTGQPVNAQYSRDNFGTDTQGTGAKPGILIYNATGNSAALGMYPSATANSQNYGARNGS